MSDSTAGHIKHGFLAGVYELWANIEGSEWGESIDRLIDAYGTDYVWSDAELDTFHDILRSHFEDAWEDGFFEEEYLDEVMKAREGFTDIAKYWEKRSVEMKEWFVFGEALSLVPDWMKSPPQPEQVQYQIETLSTEVGRLEAELEKRQQELAALRREAGE